MTRREAFLLRGLLAVAAPLLVATWVSCRALICTEAPEQLAEKKWRRLKWRRHWQWLAVEMSCSLSGEVYLIGRAMKKSRCHLLETKIAVVDLDRQAASFGVSAGWVGGNWVRESTGFVVPRTA